MFYLHQLSKSREGGGSLLGMSGRHNTVGNLSGINHSVLSDTYQSILTLFQVVPIMFDPAKNFRPFWVSGGPNVAGSMSGKGHFVLGGMLPFIQ